MTLQQQALHELVEFDGARGKIKVALKAPGQGQPARRPQDDGHRHQRDLVRSDARPADVARLELRTEIELEKLALRKTSVMTLTSW